MVYTTYYQGVQVSSNIPLDSGQAGNYDVKIYWSNNALGWIESKVAEGFTALNNYTGQITTKLVQEFESQFGPDHISNITFNANNQYAEFTFTLGSPSIFDWAGIIIFVIIWGVAIATAFDVIGVGAAMIYSILDLLGISTLDWFFNEVSVLFTDINKAVGTGAGSIIEIAIVGSLLVGMAVLGIILYEKFK